MVRAQGFAQAGLVVADQVVGRIEDVAEAAVVLLQLDLVLDLKFAHKVGHVAHAGTPEGVNALVVVAHGQNRTFTALARQARQLLEPSVLQLVGVLKLVHQNMAEAAAVMLAHMHVVAQQLIRAQHQLAKIHHAFTQALLFVQLVQLHLSARLVVAHRHIARALAVFFASRNEILHLLGRKAVFVHIELLAQPLDGRQLVLRVQNLERLRQPRQLVMRPQKTVAQPVECANPHGIHIHRQHGLQPQLHLLGGLVGEGHRQNAARRNLRGLQQPGNAGGQHPRLARPCARQNQRMLGRQGHGTVLLAVQLGEQRRRIARENVRESV